MAWRGGRDSPGLVLWTCPNCASQVTAGPPTAACPVKSKAVGIGGAQVWRRRRQEDEVTQRTSSPPASQEHVTVSPVASNRSQAGTTQPHQHTASGTPKACITFLFCCDPVTVGTRAPLTCTATDRKGRDEMDCQRSWESTTGTNRPQGGPGNDAFSLPGVKCGFLLG